MTYKSNNEKPNSSLRETYQNDLARFLFFVKQQKNSLTLRLCNRK